MRRLLLMKVSLVWTALVPPLLLVLLHPVREGVGLSALSGNSVPPAALLGAGVYVAAHLASVTFTPTVLLSALLQALLRRWLGSRASSPSAPLVE